MKYLCRLLFFFSFFILTTCNILVQMPEKRELNINTPEIVPKGDVFKEEVNVKITTSTEEAYIYYTIDGSDPSKENFFDGGKEIVRFTVYNKTIKAVAFKNGYYSKISTEVYE